MYAVEMYRSHIHIEVMAVWNMYTLDLFIYIETFGAMLSRAR